MKKSDYYKYIITPSSRYCYGVAIKNEFGEVIDSDNILRPDESTTKLIYSKGGEKPKIIVDLGQASPGGYPVFSVKSKKGTPQLRVSYSDWYGYIIDETSGEKGDFVRGSCKYLGVELPVLPGNPNRFELYTINRTGVFAYPLIQGQQRFVKITLDTEDTEVELSCFYIYYTSDMSDYDGAFSCDNNNLNKLWYASTYTVQLASIENSNSWDIVERKLAVRALTKGNDAGICRLGYDWKNYIFEFDAQIARNPHCSSGIGWIVNAPDSDNGIVCMLDLDGTFHKYIRKSGINKEIEPSVHLPFTIKDNYTYSIKTILKDNSYQIFIDETEIDSFFDPTYQKGTIGFCQTVEKWAFVENVRVTINNEFIFTDYFDKDLDNWEFTRTISFIADGSKRDRLPWIGDLYWAGRNVYYAFQNLKYMSDSLRMFARHQTPQGFIWGTCYPENTKEIDKNVFGYYESDIFSAWFVPTLADYLLFTNDLDLAVELYQNVTKDLNYLWSYVERDGLFYQRYETSKGLWDHVLNDFGKYSYNNLVVYFAFEQGAFIAKQLGKEEDSAEFLRRAEIIKDAIMANFWDDKCGYLTKDTGNRKMCEMSCSIALCIKFLSDEMAEKVVSNMREWHKTNVMMGKIVSLFISGCFNYGFDETAFAMLTGKTGNENFDELPGVNWVASITDENGPSTTTECMFYPMMCECLGRAWGDSSHPDTAVAHIITGYILGVQPVDIGFNEFVIEPHLCGLKEAKGIVPTPYGNIELEWKLREGILYITLSHPCQTKPIIVTPEEFLGKTVIEVIQEENLPAVI